jgi:hypothetical protein
VDHREAFGHTALCCCVESENLLASKEECRDIAPINRTRLAGGFSGRPSPGNQLSPAHIIFDIAAASHPIGPPQ